MSDWYRVLITGSRSWPLEDRSSVLAEIGKRLAEHGRITIVHGDCPTGVDLYARQFAERNILRGMSQGEAWVRHEAYPALWDEFDKAAGPIRNKYMTQLEADECLAFPTAASRGTVSCMDLAWAAGIPVVNYGAPVQWAGARR